MGFGMDFIYVRIYVYMYLFIWKFVDVCTGYVVREREGNMNILQFVIQLIYFRMFRCIYMIISNIR